MDSGFCGVDSGFPDSVPVELGFRITGSRIQDSLECVPDFQNQGFRIQQQILLDSGFSQVKIFRISQFGFSFMERLFVMLCKAMIWRGDERGSFYLP